MRRLEYQLSSHRDLRFQWPASIGVNLLISGAIGRYYFFFPRFLAALPPLEPLLGWLPAGGQYYVVGER
jgi:hypothetical protein